MPTHPNPSAWAALLWPATDIPFVGSDEVAVFSGGEASSLSIPDNFLAFESLGCLTEPPEGLGLPGIRNGDVNRAQRDGVIRTADWYEPRTITMTVEVSNDSCPGCPSARSKVRKIERIWSRLETSITDDPRIYWLVLYPDTFNQADVGTEAQEWNGPYMILGRPRGCDVTWHYSNEGRATVQLRFDAVDHRLILPEVDPTYDADGENFQPSQCLQVYGPGSGVTRYNWVPDPRLTGVTGTYGDGAATVSHVTAGGPHALGYHQFEVTTASTTSPFVLAQPGTGTAASPVTGGAFYRLSAYYLMSEVLGSRRFSVDWYDGEGAEISTTVSETLETPAVSGAWYRDWTAVEAPEGAEFATVSLEWDGAETYPVGFVGRSFGIMLEEDYEAETLGGVLPPHWYFDGGYYGEWQGTAHNSVSVSTYPQRNMSVDPRATLGTTWLTSWSGGAVSTTLVSGATDGPPLGLLEAVQGTPAITSYHRYTVTTASAQNFFAFNAAAESRQGAYHAEPSGTQRVRFLVAMRVSRSGLSGHGVAGGLLDSNSIDLMNGTAGTPLTPGEWHVAKFVARSTSPHIVGFTPGAWISGGTLQVGDTIEVTASYTEAEEFYEQPTDAASYFDGETDGAFWTPSEPRGSALNWQLGDGRGSPDGMVVAGTQCVHPTIRMNGPLVAPTQIAFREGDREFSYYFNHDLEEGEFVFLDTRNRVLSNLGTFDFNKDLYFFGDVGPVGPGPVDVQVLTTFEDTGQVEVCWENYVVGG